MISNELVDRLAGARNVAVLTGAGVSAESGVPTFRDAAGLWQRFRPEELASVDAFLRNPQLVQGWYGHRRRILDEVSPNPGHFALAELEQIVEDSGGNFLLATQNVDNLHQRAGSRHVVELHGNLTRNYCMDCGDEPVDLATLLPDESDILHCSSCQGLIRPDVVWFGEILPEDALRSAMAAAANCDVFLAVGTSAVVYPAAGIPLIAVDAGAFVVEVNIERSAIADNLSEVIIGSAGQTLPRIVEAVQRAQGSAGSHR